MTASSSRPPAARVVDAVRTFRAGGAEVRALDGVTLDFATGRLTAVVGRSGSGKSTLVHCLAGLDRLTAGEVHLGDVALGALRRRRRTLVRREHIGVVFQRFNLHPGLDVAANLALPARIAGRTLDAERVDAIVERLRLRHLMDRHPSELSGGEQQRVAAARALVGRPRVLLADEPTGNLDRASSRALLEVLRAAADEFDQTVIVVTHDLESACVADHVVALGDGRVLETLDAPSLPILTRIVHA